MCCACVSGCTLPPMLPNVISGWPSFITKPAMIVWNGRLRGATMFGLFGSSEKAEPRLCSTKPYGATVARLP